MTQSQDGLTEVIGGAGDPAAGETEKLMELYAQVGGLVVERGCFANRPAPWKETDYRAPFRSSSTL